MSMSDPIADMLSRIRNAVMAGHGTVDVPASRLKGELCRVLKEEGYIADFLLETEPVPGLLRLTLKYSRERKPVIEGMRRVSKPSLRVYTGATDFQPVMSGLGIAIVSTSKGVMTAKQARKEHVGGEVLCEVW